MSVQEKSLRVVLKKISGLETESLTEAVVEWRSVWMATGVQCVMMAGTSMMLLQCADNWDTQTLVYSNRAQTYNTCIQVLKFLHDL